MVALIDSEWGIILIVAAVLILFGSTKLPKFARSLGSAQSEFKKGLAEGHKGTDGASAAAASSPSELSAPAAPASGARPDPAASAPGAAGSETTE